eukprot:gi/632948261/ref/XP_007889493.1/ PREDICTED: inosine-uridine preferring nucleoside hydrolase-like [Callorhinchus milii]
MGKKLLLMDVDCGVDDAQAIMMALAAPNVQLLGITCCHGNTPIDNVCKNVLRVLKVCHRMEIPVFRGACLPLLEDEMSGAVYHGTDGLGDAPDPSAPGLEQVQTEHAVNAMIRIIAEHPGQVRRTQCREDNYNRQHSRESQGGRSGARLANGSPDSAGRGNVSVCGEFNFRTDPEAAYIVLNQFTCPTYISTWEYCIRHPLSWEFFKDWVNQDSAKAQFMKRITAHSETFAKSERGLREQYQTPGFVPCDSYAVAAMIDESVVTEWEECGVSVELRGSLTRGMMVLDTLDLLKKESRAFLMKKCNIEKFQQLMVSILK